MKLNCFNSHFVSKPYSIEDMKMVQFAKALSHPVRLFILKELLACNEGNVSSLMEKLPIKQSTISRHIKELKFAGLIDTIVKPPKVWYRVNENNWKKADKVFRDFFGFFYSTSSNKSF